MFDVVVVGHFGARLGMGQAARDVVRALQIAGLNVAAVDPVPLEPARSGVPFPTVPAADAVAPVTICCLNPPEMRWLANTPDLVLGDRRIGMWFWELTELPDSWRSGFEGVDEVWVTCDLTRDAVAAHSPVPVLKVPLPVPGAPAEASAGVPFPLPAGFCFLFAFDYLSTLARKNPLGLIDAFGRAFSPGQGASLVLKPFNATLAPLDHDIVRRAAGRHPDIHVVDRWVSDHEWDALLRAADAYVSLHRSEAFGRTVAEAMLRGKPVITTNYGGVLEYADDTNAYLVRSHPVRVGPGVRVYPEDGTWAEPDLAHAADTMRAVVADPSDAAARGANGAADIQRRYAPEVAGVALRDALHAVQRRSPSRPRPPLSVVVATTVAWPQLEETLTRLRAQAERVGAELIMVDGHGRGVPDEEALGITVLRAPASDVFALRAFGARHARGEIVAFTEDHCVPDDDWCERMLAAHAAQPDAAAVIGAVRNGSTETLADRANFLATFAMFQPPLDRVPPDRVPPFANVSFRRDVLHDLPSEPGALEVELLPRLHCEGQIAGGGGTVEHRQSHGGLRTYAMHFHNGRAIGGQFQGRLSPEARRARLRWCVGLPVLMVRQTRGAMDARSGGQPTLVELASVAVLGACHGVGHWLGCARGPGRSRDALM